MRWIETDKGDPRCRELADRHYTRQTVGHPLWTRPGWNQVLYAEQRNGRSASFAWWRPKWESGLKGTERKDGLRAIECAIFRNETRFRSSDLIDEAMACLMSWPHANDVEWPDGIITGVGSKQTSAGRSPDHEPGWCFREAGFVDFPHLSGRADVWLRYEGPGLGVPGCLRSIAPVQSARLIERRTLTPKNANQLALPMEFV
jgi:hypothetical protein